MCMSKQQHSPALLALLTRRVEGLHDGCKAGRRGGVTAWRQGNSRNVIALKVWVAERMQE